MQHDIQRSVIGLLLKIIDIQRSVIGLLLKKTDIQRSVIGYLQKNKQYPGTICFKKHKTESKFKRTCF